MKKSLIISAAVIILAATATTSFAQNSTPNIAPNIIAPPPGGGFPPTKSMFGSNAGRFNICAHLQWWIQRTTRRNFLRRRRIRQWGNYSLSAGGCNNGQQFLGGNLNCNGIVCNWTPSPAGFAAGFRSETVYAQYQ